MSLPSNSGSSISSQRARQEISARFNPLRGFTPQRVVRLLEDYDKGRLRDVVWMMDKVQRTDDMVKTVSGKRKKAPARLDWSIRPYESWEDFGSAKQLEDQTAHLQHLYNSLQVSHALERNLRGGLRKAVEQMADAIAKGFAVHEIGWQQRRDGLMEVSLTFVPLWFFENTTGQLRFLEHSGAADGVELEENAWMVTCGDSLLEATLTAYMFKALPLKDWLTYSERAGMPFPTMETDAKPGSPEWEEALVAMSQIGAEYGLLHSRGARIEIHDLTVKGELPSPRLVERMDRAIAMLWRGADLSTMSGEDQMGASLQQGESDILIEDDVAMINETLEHALSLPALRARFGADVRPMCYFALSAPDRLDEAAEQNKMHAAADYGVQIPVSDYRERLNLPGVEADEADAVLTPPAGGAGGFGGFANAAEREGRSKKAEGRSEEIYRERSLAKLAEARAEDLAPLLAALAELEEAKDPADYAERLERLRDQLATFLPGVNESEYAAALEAVLGGAVAAGAVEAGKRKKDEG